LKAARNIPLWKHAEMQKRQQKLEAEAAKKIGEDPKMTKTQPQKPLWQQISYVVKDIFQKLFSKKREVAVVKENVGISN